MVKLDIQYYDSIQGDRLRKAVSKHFHEKPMHIKLEQSRAKKRNDDDTIFFQVNSIEMTEMPSSQEVYADATGQIVDKADIEVEYKAIIDDKDKEFFSSNDFRTILLVTIEGKVRKKYSASLWDTKIK